MEESLMITHVLRCLLLPFQTPINEILAVFLENWIINLRINSPAHHLRYLCDSPNIHNYTKAALVIEFHGIIETENEWNDKLKNYIENINHYKWVKNMYIK